MNGLARTGLFTADHMMASDPFAHSRDKLKGMGIKATDDNVEVVNESNIIIIAVKPNVRHTDTTHLSLCICTTHYTTYTCKPYESLTIILISMIFLY